MKSKLAKQVFHLSSFFFNPGKIHEPPVHNRDIRRILRKIFHDFILSHSARRLSAGFSVRVSAGLGGCDCERVRGAFFLLPFTFLIFTFTLSLFTFLSCRSDKTPVSTTQAKITISADYVAVTEVWLKVELENRPENVLLKIWRDTTIVFNGSFSGTDTTVLDTNLLPAHQYTYKSAILKNGKILVNSPPLKITTIDTTSHDFQWEVIEIPSPYGSGVLRDVTIINENEIWAVGEIYSDSVQSWVPYNAVHWDGQNWELKKIKTESCGGVEYPPLRTILSFSSNNILFAHTDASITTYNGNSFVNDCSFIQQINGSINKMWGINNSDLYVVGDDGIIAHYNGQNWQKIESGTNLPIQDIWGVVGSKTGKETVLAVASNLFHNEGIAVLRIENNEAKQIQTNNLPVNISGVWSQNGREWYICGSGLYKTGSLNKAWENVPGLPLIFQSRVRGSNINNMFVVGHFGLVLHWNGYTWKKYQGLDGLYLGLAVTNDLVVAVGTKTVGPVADSGIILVGKRN